MKKQKPETEKLGIQQEHKNASKIFQLVNSFTLHFWKHQQIMLSASLRTQASEPEICTTASTMI